MKLIYQAVVAFLLLSFAVQANARDSGIPDVKVGDRWAWQHSNGLASEMDYTLIEDVISVSANEIRTRQRIKGTISDGINTYTREWNLLDTPSARYKPEYKTHAFPLAVGKKWSATSDKMLYASGAHGVFTVLGEIVAKESVTVPAGTFTAYKIVLKIGAMSTGPDARTAETVDAVWYSPEARQFVKREVTFNHDGRVRKVDVYEMLEYTLR